MIPFKAFIRIRRVLSASIISSWSKTVFYVVGLVELNFYKLIQILDFLRKENNFATIILIPQESFTSNLLQACQVIDMRPEYEFLLKVGVLERKR